MFWSVLIKYEQLDFEPNSDFYVKYILRNVKVLKFTGLTKSRITKESNLKEPV